MHIYIYKHTYMYIYRHIDNYTHIKIKMYTPRGRHERGEGAGGPRQQGGQIVDLCGGHL